jgi:hypothetical protein
VIAERATKLARCPAPGTELDAPKASTAFRTDDVTFSHGARIALI